MQHYVLIISKHARIVINMQQNGHHYSFKCQLAAFAFKSISHQSTSPYEQRHRAIGIDEEHQQSLIPIQAGTGRLMGEGLGGEATPFNFFCIQNLSMSSLLMAGCLQTYQNAFAVSVSGSDSRISLGRRLCHVQRHFADLMNCLKHFLKNLTSSILSSSLEANWQSDIVQQHLISPASKHRLAP